jgi:hypothetical protein
MIRHPRKRRSIALTPDEREPDEPQWSAESLGDTLAALSNPELLSAVDSVLLELERRLLRYARIGPELLEMAEEGLVLAVRTRARLAQAQSSAVHAVGHLQIVGIGDWNPQSTNPSWSDDPRVHGDQD